MSFGKWALFASAIASGIAAALGTLPYPWARIVSTALSAGMVAYLGGAGSLAAYLESQAKTPAVPPAAGSQKEDTP